MKQALMLIIVTAMIIAGGMWENKYLDTSSQYFLSDINYSKNAVNNNNFDLAQKHFEQVESTWNSISGVWNILVDHSEIDNIEDNLTKYKSYIKRNDKEESLVYADTLDKSLRHVVESEKVNVHNIF